MKTVKLLIGGLACLGVAAGAEAFQDAGHLYTANLVMHMSTAQLDTDDRALITFCTQLPDESADLDATTVYYTMGIFTDSSNIANVYTRRMVTVQQLLHGLTGGQAGELNAAAGEILASLAKQIFSSSSGTQQRLAADCALGFGFHLYGDSYAHRVLVKPAWHHPPEFITCSGDKDGSEGCTMYPTGLGHAWDYHYPDWPLCGYKTCGGINKMGSRFQNWRDWGVQAASYLTATGSGGSLTNPTQYAAYAQEIFDTMKSEAPEGDDFDEPSMQKYLEKDAEAQTDGGRYTAKLFADFFGSTMTGLLGDTEQPCESVFRLASRDQLVRTQGSSPCQDAWCAFAKAAMRAFDAHPAARDSSIGYKYYPMTKDKPDGAYVEVPWGPDTPALTCPLAGNGS